MRIWARTIACICTLLIAVGFVAFQALPAHAESDATLDTPQLVVQDSFSEWTMAAGMFYWAERCIIITSAEDEVTTAADGDTVLKRRPVNGTIIRTLGTMPPPNCSTFFNMNADADGVYYFNPLNVGDLVPGLYFRPSGDPYDPPRLLTPTTTDNPKPGSRLFPAGDWVYWITGTQIRRVHKDGGGGIQIAASTGANPMDLLVLGNTLYWLDDTGLWNAPLNCDDLPCGKNLRVPGTRGNYLRHVPSSGPIITLGTRIMWVETNTGNAKIVSTVCGGIVFPGPIVPGPIAPGGLDTAASDSEAEIAQSCSEEPDPIYTSPSSDWKIGRFGHIGPDLFFEEGFWNFETSGRRVRRHPIAGGTTATIYPFPQGADPGPVFTDNTYVYFAQRPINPAQHGIYSLPFNATAITWDLQASFIEVTQGIQNLNNGVTLVASKPTMVRAFANHNLGPAANMVEARLHGSRGGNPLPGSPLAPLNGTRSLQTGAPINRTNTDTNWVFQIPASWYAPGSTEFRLEIDPRQIYDDPNRGNNSLTRTVNFVNKAPICQVFIPVRTHAPAASTNLSIFWPMVNMTKRLLPTADIWAYKQNSDVAETQVCWAGPFPYPCFGPYEIPSDDWKIMSSLWIRDQFSDDPDACDDANARTHYTGLMHPSTSTGGLNGMGRLGGDQLFIHMPPLSAAPLDWTSSTRVATLAHELGHNYSRNHINCGGPASPDMGYPYTNPDSCRLDDRPISNAATYFGFDLQTRQPIQPAASSIRDLMAYGQRRWPSNYTWSAIFNGIDNRAGIAGEMPGETAAEAEAQIAAIELVSSHGTVLVTGGITPTLEQGELDYAWVIPPGAATSGMLRKWQRFAAGGIEGLAPGEPAPAGIDADSYSVRLIGENETVLGTFPVTLFLLEDSDNERVAFGATFAAPEATVIRLELLADDTVIATLNPGPAQPQITVELPAGGETIDTGLTVRWTATDADTDDILKFMVQYSPDNGTTWRTLVSNYASPGGEPTVTISLTNVLDIPASNGPNARIRVLASDSYNTSVDVSEPFTVVNRKPEPYIIVPTQNTSYAAGESILFSGGGFDAEDGGLPDSGLNWSLITAQGGEIPVGSGTDVNVYGLSTGQYTATLTAEDSDGATAATAVGFRVSALRIPTTGAPTIDGLCDDTAYASAAQVQLAPYDGENQATIYLVQTASHLYACFSGLKQGAFLLPEEDASDIKSSFVGVRIDTDLSRDALAQTDDYGFFMHFDGGVFTYAGDGLGGFNEPGPGGLAGQLFVGTQTWSAEMQISLSAIGGVDHPMGIKVGHYWVDAQGDDYGWPYAASWNVPSTWAETATGIMPQITAIVPVSATVPSADIQLIVEGTGFVDGAAVRWEDTDLTTEFGSSTLLTATIPSSVLATPGTFAVTVRNPAGAGLTSNAVDFVLLGPAPVITTLSPSGTQAESGTFTLQVTGENFIPNATVYWNGEARPTLYMSNTRLDVQVPASDLEIAQLVGITVVNPEPDGQASNTLIFTIDPTSPDNPFIFMPTVERE